jgi:hypothetical protein
VEWGMIIIKRKVWKLKEQEVFFYHYVKESNMKKIGNVVLILICLTIGFSFTNQPDIDKDKYTDILKTISGRELLGYVKELSSDKYRGRLAGTPEYMLAAQYVSDKLKEWGVEPLGDKGTYFQFFKKSYVDIKDLGSVSIAYNDLKGRQTRKDYSFPDNYFPGTNSDLGEITAEVVYVGFGISSKEMGYDDYSGLDVKGKILLMESGLPVNRRNSDFAKWVPYSFHQYKQRNAVKHGAIGMLYINNIANPNTDFIPGFIYCHVSRNVARDLFKGTGRNYGGIKQYIEQTLTPASFKMHKTASIRSESEFKRNGLTCNVIGIIRGEDPKLKNEVIILGGHLDGVGYYGDIVLPGALDNGSGVANIMGVAKALSEFHGKLKRSIMFIFMGGEEAGLIGSKLYCREPKFPKDKTICYFNIDMAGTGLGVFVSGIRSFPHIFESFYEAVNKFLDFSLKTTEYWPGPGVGRPRSDAIIFKRAGFNVFNFSTFRTEGEERTKIYYHHPLDNVQTLQPQAMENLSRFIFVGLTQMANKETLID